MFEESTSLLVAAGPESTSRLRSTTQLRRGALILKWRMNYNSKNSKMKTILELEF